MLLVKHWAAEMRFAFGIVSLFPGGGLQRDCVDVARRVRNLGHEVTIFTARKSPEPFAGDLTVRVLAVERRSNHGRQCAFSDALREHTAGQFDVVVGFDKLDGLDVLYCSDRSIRARATRNPLLYLFPRYRCYIELERSCFAPHSATKILLVSEPQLDEYWTAWTTEPHRLILLPPTLAPERRRPEYRTDGTRQTWRASLGLSADDWIWIAVCVQPKTKGLDRVIRALRHFPDARLLIVGLREDEAKSTKIREAAERLRLATRIHWLGHREDIPELMAAADLLVHPARYDTTGTVILEAIANGLPVITTSSCGYARHVGQADAGVVLTEPFQQSALIGALRTAHDPRRLAHWSRCGAEYGHQDSLCRGRWRAAQFIAAAGAQPLETDRPLPQQLARRSA